MGQVFARVAMPLTEENSGALIPGPKKKEERSMKTRDIIVVRAFMYERKPWPVGARLTVPFFFASEVVSANKAEYVPEPAKVESAKQEPEIASEPAKGPIKTKKEDK